LKFLIEWTTKEWRSLWKCNYAKCYKNEVWQKQQTNFPMEHRRNIWAITISFLAAEINKWKKNQYLVCHPIYDTWVWLCMTCGPNGIQGTDFRFSGTGGVICTSISQMNQAAQGYMDRRYRWYQIVIQKTLHIHTQHAECIIQRLRLPRPVT